jgi:hypothetical protein
VRLVSRTTGGLLWRDFATAARPGTEVVFEIEQPAGLYLMTLHVRDDEAATGPFTVSDASGPVLGDVQVERGASWIRTVPLRLRDGRTALRFSGDWKVNALTLQAILGEAEDFLFGRPYWNLPEPGE